MHQENCVHLNSRSISWQAKFEGLCYPHMEMYPETSRPSLAAHARCTRDLVHQHLSASTRVRLHCLPVAQALPQHRRAPQLVVIRPHEFYLNTVVRRDYSSPGRTGSTSTSPCAASTRLPAAAALHRLRHTPPRRRLLGVRLPRLVSTRKLVENGFRGINN
jgi:hypothetical protein